jgi:hypothetical protein
VAAKQGRHTEILGPRTLLPLLSLIHHDQNQSTPTTFQSFPLLSRDLRPQIRSIRCQQILQWSMKDRCVRLIISGVGKGDVRLYHLVLDLLDPFLRIEPDRIVGHCTSLLLSCSLPRKRLGLLLYLMTLWLSSGCRKWSEILQTIQSQAHRS